MRKFKMYNKHGAINLSGAFNFISSNSNYILFISLFIAGLICGAAIINAYSAEGLIASVVDAFVPGRQNIWRTFINSVALSVALELICFCAGLCCVGFPISCMLPLFKGVYYGIIAAYLFPTNEMQGLLIYMLTVLPGATLSVSAMLVACNYSAYMSKALAANVFMNSREEVNVKHFALAHLLILAIFIAAALIDVLCVKLFQNIINL